MTAFAHCLAQTLMANQSQQLDAFSIKQSQQIEAMLKAESLKQSKQLEVQSKQLEELQADSSKQSKQLEVQSKQLEVLQAEMVSSKKISIDQYTYLANSFGRLIASSDSTMQIEERIDSSRTAVFAFKLAPATVQTLWTSFRDALSTAHRPVQQAFGEVESRGVGFCEMYVQRAFSFLVKWLCRASSSAEQSSPVAFRDTHDRFGPVCPQRRPDLSFLLPGTPSAQEGCQVSWVHLVTVGELKQQLSGHSATVQAHDYAVFMMRRQPSRQYATSFTSDGRAISFWKFDRDGTVSCFGGSELLLWTADTTDDVVPEGFAQLAEFLFAPPECHGFCRIQESQLPAEVIRKHFGGQLPILERAANETRPAVFSSEVLSLCDMREA